MAKAGADGGSEPLSVGLGDLNFDLQKRVFGYISTYLLTLIAGVTIGFINIIEGAIDQVTNIVSDAGRAATSSAASGVSVIGDGFVMLADTIADVSAALGPFGPIVIAGVGVAAIALSIRALRGVADGIPVISGIQTFLEGK